jgi:hypothetical protein
MGRKLNKGYIAEAYEEHLAIHHTTAYNLFNKSKSLSVLDKGIMITTAIEDISSAGNWWASHESMSKAWSHITSSMGRQRGTVAGDVGRVQVKSGYSYSTYGRKVRLASLATLKDGV